VSARVLSARVKAQRAERALDALSLGVTTQADKARIVTVQIGLVALDEEQSNLKATIEGLLVSIHTGYSETEVLEDLRDMVKKWKAER
jgi:hypothetical protein